MITIVKSGTYKLIETKANIKILYIDNQPYAWISSRSIGQILVTSHVAHKADRILSMGKFIMYDVQDEPYLTDLLHIELEYGAHAWQGYLLPTGLPGMIKKRSRIIPTTQIITGNPRFNRMGLYRWKTLIPAHVSA